MKYFVTFCTFDREAGANPLWHSCILFSKMDETTKLLEVVDNWGFYGVPTTQRDNSWLSQLKIKIGLDVDLIGNHGMLRHEEVRWLDLGRGLHGTTFELTQEKFDFLQQSCLKMAEDQEKAISEVVDTQGIKGKSPKETRVYPHEQFSRIIYEIEKIKAQQQQRASRLKPFELRWTWGSWGPTLAESFNCKSQALSLLSLVLSEEQIHRLTDWGKHPTVPRYSGPNESIYLFSTGSLREHKKASGKIVHFRDGKDPDVKLYWTVPPQNLEALTQDTIDLLAVDDEYCDEIKATVRKLQQLEWVLRNASVPAEYQSIKSELLQRVIECYRSFAIVEPKEQTPKISGLLGYGLWLLSAPRSKDEQQLQEKIKRAKALLNELYFAVVDHAEIDSDDPETVASVLSREDKIELCKTIGRNFCEDDESEEDTYIPTAAIGS